MMTVLITASLGGCAWLTGSQKYSVYFPPYSAQLDQQALETVQAAADFAHTHPLRPVAIDGFAAPPDPRKAFEDLSAQRAEAVRQALLNYGVGPQRITASANGTVNPKPLPALAVRRVDISVGW